MTISSRGHGRNQYHSWEPSDELHHHFQVRAHTVPPASEVPEPVNAAGTPEDTLRGQLEQLPTEEQVHILVQLLRTPELREVAAGVINDVAAGCKSEDILEVAGAINGWIATAEETVTSRRKLRNIIAARERMRKPAEDAD